MTFAENVQRLQRSYYCGKIDRKYAVALMDALMHEFKMLGENEHLVDIPDDFGRHFENTGFLGEFTVQAEGSPFQWKRSYADRSLTTQKVTLFTEAPKRRVEPPAARGFTWQGSVGNRRQVPAPPVLSKEEQEFFAPYEPQVTAGMAMIEGK